MLGPDRESHHLEYKSTLRTSVATGEVLKVLESASLKTIAAFLNSREGGTLLIGVADDGSLHGLATDYDFLAKEGKDSRDLFGLWHRVVRVGQGAGDAGPRARHGRRRQRRWRMRAVPPRRRSPSSRRRSSTAGRSRGWR